MKTIRANELKDGEFAIIHSLFNNIVHEGRLVQRQSKRNRLVLLDRKNTGVGDSFSDNHSFLVKPISKSEALEIIKKMDSFDRTKALFIIGDDNTIYPVKKKYTVIHNIRVGFNGRTIITKKKYLNTTNLKRSVKNLDVVHCFDGWCVSSKN